MGLLILKYWSCLCFLSCLQYFQIEYILREEISVETVSRSHPVCLWQTVCCSKYLLLRPPRIADPTTWNRCEHGLTVANQGWEKVADVIQAEGLGPAWSLVLNGVFLWVWEKGSREQAGSGPTTDKQQERERRFVAKSFRRCYSRLTLPAPTKVVSRVSPRTFL